MELLFLQLLNRVFTRRDKLIISFLLLLSIVVSIVETVSISALMFFISLATNFDLVFKYSFITYFYHYSQCARPVDFIIMLGFCLSIFFCLRALLNTIHSYSLNHFAYLKQYVLATTLFNRYMHLPYQSFATQNSSTLHHILFTYLNSLTHVINGLLTLCAESFTVVCIYGMLFYVNWKITLVLTVVLLCKIVLIIKIFSSKIRAAGKHYQRFSLAAGKIFTESFGNFKFLKLINNQEPISKRFAEQSFGYAQAHAINGVWQTLPRFVLETVGFIVLIAILMYVLFRYNDARAVIPMVSMYALAFYRFLPSLNKMMTSYNQVMFNKHALRPVCDFLQVSHEQFGQTPLLFKKKIKIHHVSFSYVSGKNILKEVTITVHKGERVGFMGPSGAGKSTLSDLLMGLLMPTQGTLSVDDILVTRETCVAWRQKIGYVPQSIYLFDGTVAANVVCGRSYDESKIINALQKAHIYDFLVTHEGIETAIGEGGINLSGGQKQRIALARALYGEPDVLVLDEATSALDHETEENIMHEIYQLDRAITLIIIAHRLTTIQRCDRVFLVDQGQVVEVFKKHQSVASGMI